MQFGKRFRWAALGYWMVTLAVLNCARLGRAQTEEEEVLPVPKPIVIVNGASVERVLQELGRRFEEAGRPDVYQMIEDTLINVAGSLQGIDRTRPFGMMLFLEESLPPQPRPVVYVPISDAAQFLQTLSLGPKVKKTADDTYEISEDGGQTAYLRFVDDYALISMLSEEYLDRKIPSPADVVGPLTERYDLAATVKLSNISKDFREVFTFFFRQQSQAELQQFDEESDADFQIRKANGENLLHLIEQVLRDGEALTLGLDASADGSRAVIEMQVEATPDSEFSQFLKNIAGKPTMFEPLLSDAAPFTLSASWNMDQREKDAATGILKGMMAQIEATHENGNVGDETLEGFQKMGTAAQATIEAGHLDAFFQFKPTKEGQMIYLGGVKFVGPETMQTGLRTMLGDSHNESEFKLDLDFHQYQNVSLHRLQFDSSDRGSTQMFGENAAMYIGMGGNILWFGMGGDQFISTFDQAVDLTMSHSPGTRTISTAPFQLVFRMAPWMQLSGSENDPDRWMFEEAMGSGQDGIRVEFRPTEAGARLRIQFDEGFVKLLALALANQYDESLLEGEPEAVEVDSIQNDFDGSID